MQPIAEKKIITRCPQRKVVSLVLLCLDHLYNRIAFYPVTMLAAAPHIQENTSIDQFPENISQEVLPTALPGIQLYPLI